MIDDTWSARLDKFSANVQGNQTLYAVFTVEEYSSLTEKQANEFKDAVYDTLLAATIVLGVAVGVGGVLFIVGVSLLIVFAVKSRNAF
jgi:hypothetical protein